MNENFVHLFGHISKHLEELKTGRVAEYILTNAKVLRNLVKHGVSRLTYQLKLKLTSNGRIKIVKKLCQ